VAVKLSHYDNDLTQAKALRRFVAEEMKTATRVSDCLERTILPAL
jgi:hypothetical protein